MRHETALSRLKAAFTDPTQWRYLRYFWERGNVCTCGEKIKRVYVWGHPDGRELLTGSTCVNNVPMLDRNELDRITTHARQEAQRQKDHAKALIEDANYDSAIEACKTSLETVIQQRADRRTNEVILCNVFRSLLFMPAASATPKSAVELFEAFILCPLSKSRPAIGQRATYMLKRLRTLEAAPNWSEISDVSKNEVAAHAHDWLAKALK